MVSVGFGRETHALGGQDQIELAGREDHGFGLLAEMWRVKGVSAGRTTGLEQLLRNQQTGVTFDKSRKLKPTIFAEYSCGPESCYAIVYSAAARGTRRG